MVRHTTPKADSDAKADLRKEEICAGCPQTQQCRQVWSAPQRGPFNAVGLALASALAFLGPLITAIIGAGIAHVYAARPGSISWPEVAGATAGLISGAFAARLLVPLVRKYFS